MTDQDIPPSKICLEEIYSSHHEKGDKYGRLRCRERGSYLRDWIGEGKDVLDIGCRDGELTKYFCAGNRVVGADIDRQALELAREKLGIETCWLDANSDLPFAPESFDVVTACEVMEHVHYSDAFLSKIHDVLKPGGLFLGSVPNAFRLSNRLKFLLGMEFDKDPTHVHIFSETRLRRLLSRRFRDLRLVPIGGHMLPGLRVPEAAPHFLGMLFARSVIWKCVK